MKESSLILGYKFKKIKNVMQSLVIIVAYKHAYSNDAN